MGVHVKPWGLAPFLPMPAAELCDRPATVERVWGRPAVTELRRRLTSADAPHEMLMVLEEELVRRLRAVDGLDIVRYLSSAIAETGGAVPIGDLGMSARASSTYVAKRFKEVIGVTPKRLAPSYRFTFTVLGIDVAEPIDWGEVAAGAGYFDQADFMDVALVVLGSGKRCFGSVDSQHLLEDPDVVVQGNRVLHLRYRARR